MQAAYRFGALGGALAALAAALAALAALAVLACLGCLRASGAAAGAPAPAEATPFYLTLGDGDFSYSLDLCRFLASTSSSKVASAAAHVTCSGIDSSDEVRAKYRDADSILRKISSLDQCHVAKRRAKKRRRLANNTEGESSPAVDPTPLSVRVEHGVNSIIMPGRNAELNTCNNRCYQHVIFNHPHIGHESAALHRRFLAHLFHTVDQHWLAPRAVFHLTLVSGQAGRWNCLEAAANHGFALLNRDAFRPPPPPSSRSTLGTETYFKSRRHQSGRSFATRSEGSETLTFGRICDEKKGYVARHLPWQNMPQTEIKTEDNLLQCPHCAQFPFIWPERAAVAAELSSALSGAHDAGQNLPYTTKR